MTDIQHFPLVMARLEQNDPFFLVATWLWKLVIAPGGLAPSRQHQQLFTRLNIQISRMLHTAKGRETLQASLQTALETARWPLCSSLARRDDLPDQPAAMATALIARWEREND